MEFDKGHFSKYNFFEVTTAKVFNILFMKVLGNKKYIIFTKN